MISQPIEQTKYTRQEDLDFEVTSEERHEYIDGQIRKMVGGTPNQEYVLIDQYSPQIEHYRKTDTNQGLDSILTLGGGGMTISWADIYDQVTFK